MNTEGFLFGTATAAFQVEGALPADGRGRSIWDDLQDVPGAIRGGDRADHCCRSWEHWSKDLALLIELGVDAYRFSISWPRVVPDGDGEVNVAGLDQYDRMVEDLVDAGIAPFVTLFHWDLPSALQARGGFAQRSTGDAFVRYAEVIAKRLGDRVAAFVTHNEPAVFANLGHADGIHAPALRDRGVAVQVAHELLVSHGGAVEVLREHAPNAQVGITLDINVTGPADPADPTHVEAARRVDAQWARWFLDPLHGRGYPQDVLAHLASDAPVVRPDDLDLIATPTDFLGLNHYRRITVAPVPDDAWAATIIEDPDQPVTAFGWEIHPPGMGQVLRRIHRDYAPSRIYVLENGAAFDDAPDADGFVQDDERIAYLDTYLAELLAAREDGVPVDGWFVWSLLDNFEWAEGFHMRFGLVRTEAGTPTRIPKASFTWYRDRIRQTRPVLP